MCFTPATLRGFQGRHHESLDIRVFLWRAHHKSFTDPAKAGAIYGSTVVEWDRRHVLAKALHDFSREEVSACTLAPAASKERTTSAPTLPNAPKTSDDNP